MARLSFGQKLNLILWKDWNVELHHWRHVIFCFCTSFLFALLLVVLRFLIKAERFEVTKYEPIDLNQKWGELLELADMRKELLPSFQYNSYIVPRKSIAYAPNTSDYVNSIMEKAHTEYIEHITLISYATTSELQAAMTSEYYLLGVKFDVTEEPKKESEEEKSIYPNTLSFSLLFPSEQRIWDSSAKFGANWHTYELYDSHSEEKHRNIDQNDGGYVGYVREGFVTVQTAISMAFISLRAPDKTLPTIKLQRFPRMAGSNDPLILVLRFNVSFLLIFGFLYPCLYITSSFNKQKEYDIMAFLHVMGISYTVQMIAWFINSFVKLFITSLLFIAAMKIHWSDGFAILNNSSWLAVLALMTAFIFASISFTFMVSSCFAQRSTATLMLVLLWIFTYALALTPALTYSTPLKLMICIFSNCCMSIALDQMLKFESLGHGFLWSSFFDSATIESELTNGVLTIFLLLLSILYALIGHCMFYWRAGLLETPKKIRNTYYFKYLRPFTKKRNVVTRPRSSSHSGSVVIRSRRLSKLVEVKVDLRRTFVEINGLTKIYKDTAVVKNFSLQLFDGEIMVIMGQNGAGKSTLLSMITGMVKPTAGTVLIDGIDVQEQSESFFENLGFCLQENLLVPELSVFNQMRFHCKIKGLTGERLEQEVEKYLLPLDMQGKYNMKTGELSIGLKKYLGVCCALCAQSKIVILDEPDNGMDMLVRRKLRDLLLIEKSQRTILMSTHSTEEADSIADRIAIMSGGDLMCYGSSNFLRKIYGNGYHLVCMKDERCNSSVVTSAIQKFLPVRLIPESDIGTELSYRLDQKYVGLFSNILDYLEHNLKELNIISVSIGEASIDDVFLSMGTDNAFGVDRARLSNVFNGVSWPISKDENNFRFLKKTDKYKGFRLLMSQWHALLLKRFLFNFRVRPIVFLQFLMPILFTAMSFPIANKKDIRPVLPSMTFRLTQYPESVTVLDIRDDNSNDFEVSIIDRYKELINSMDVRHRLVDTDDLLFTEFILDHQSRDQSSIYLKYLIAATFSKNELKAWFNNYGLHTLPLTLNMMHNAVLRAATNDSNALITVTLEPLPYMTNFDGDLYNDGNVGGIMAVSLTFCIGLLWSISIMSIVREREYNFKLIQFIHGARPSSYWLTVFFSDFALTIVVSICIMIVILCFQHIVFMQFELQILYFFTLILFGTFILPFNYAISWIFDDPITAFSVVTIYNLIGGVTFSTLMNVFERDYTNSLKLANTIKWIMRCIPHFALCNTLAKLFNNQNLKSMCLNEVFNAFALIHKSSKHCDRRPYCCESKRIWSWSEGLFPELLAVVTISICSVMALVIIELRNANNAGICGGVIPEDNTKAERDDFKDWHDEHIIKDESREKERIRVATLRPKEYFEKPLIIKSVGKIHKRTEEFHRIFLVLNRSECFGLLGSSMSGKTAFMKMLVQNNASSYGQIYVNGLSLRSNLYEVYDQIGYCQQISSHVNEFTGFELMKIYCMLHGIPRSEIAPICKGLARAFGFMPIFGKLIKFYSPGTKRRLRIALAMLGNPSIIYLDEPMLGLDLASLRQLCHIICQVRKSGTAVLFTSLNYNMSEIICSRIAFLVDGRLSYIGTPYELNNEQTENNSKGYLLKLKIKKISLELSGLQLGSTESIFMPNPFLRVQTFVETTFPNAVMKDQRGYVLYFVIPSKNIKLSQIFKLLDRNSLIMDIETFWVSHNTLSLFVFEIIEKNYLPSRIYSHIHL